MNKIDKLMNKIGKLKNKIGKLINRTGKFEYRNSNNNKKTKLHIYLIYLVRLNLEDCNLEDHINTSKKNKFKTTERQLNKHRR